MIDIEPVGHRVLLKMKPLEEKTESGLIIATHKEIERQTIGSEEAQVVALGPQAFRAFEDGTPWCQPGDWVFFVRYAGVHHEDEETDEHYRIVNDEDIFAKRRDQ